VESGIVSQADIEGLMGMLKDNLSEE
jgi:hypothetical protein